VNDIYINNEKPSVQKNTSLRQVIISISSSRMGATVVVDDNNKVTGIITDGDIRRLLEKKKSWKESMQHLLLHQIQRRQFRRH
jgi:arabinose-5-phosphate isomerase